MSILSSVLDYPRLAFDLRKFLHQTITLEQSIRVIEERFHNREKNFLNLVDRGIYRNPRNPYLKLLNLAGCEYGDIETMVAQSGIESTLEKLYAEGVYLSWEEFKGKKDVVRGGTSFPVVQRDLDNPHIPAWYSGQSSGSRSAGTRTKFSLGTRLEQGYYRLPMLVASNTLDIPMGIWKEVPPAMTGISHVLDFWIARKPVVRWFSTVNERQAGTSLKHRIALRYILYSSRLWGARLPWPEYVALGEAYRIAEWMADTKKQHGGCSLSSSVSSAVKVCHAAMEHNIDIQGTHFLVSGEPLTEGKCRQIQATGASVTPRYTISEVGKIGIGCSGTEAANDLHLMTDSIAMIQRRRKVDNSNVEVDAFLYTPLLPSAPKILLNVESDDCGDVSTGSCGCLFDRLGFSIHLTNVRSYGKLTGNGVSIIGSGLVNILEEVLPNKYGGAATDYQLLEEEDSRGITRLSLIISPSVGEIDEAAVVSTLLTELKTADKARGMAISLWSQAEAMRVKRMYPIQRRSKVMTLELMKTD